MIEIVQHIIGHKKGIENIVLLEQMVKDAINMLHVKVVIV